MPTLLAASVLSAPAHTRSLAPAVETTRAAPAAAVAQKRAPLLRPSNLLDKLKAWKEGRPRASARELAAYANQLLAREGFDYNFDACPAVEARRPLARSVSTAATERLLFDYTFALTSGRRVTFRLDTGDHAGMCGECFVSIPALRVTPREVLAVAGGREYSLWRPGGFTLDEAHLVDGVLKKILRTWQLPYQTIPEGVSPDGRKLYVGFYEDYDLGELVLELSEDGRLRFAVAKDVKGPEGEWIDDFPKDPKNAYLSYMRFRSGGKTHVVRFSGPCT